MQTIMAPRFYSTWLKKCFRCKRFIKNTRHAKNSNSVLHTSFKRVCSLNISGHIKKIVSCHYRKQMLLQWRRNQGRGEKGQYSYKRQECECHSLSTWSLHPSLPQSPASSYATGLCVASIFPYSYKIMRGVENDQGSDQNANKFVCLLFPVDLE